MKAPQIAVVSALLMGSLATLTLWGTTSPPAAVQVQNTGWPTQWSEKLGLRLVAQFDSSGPRTWDPKAHPLVFITTEGPGYAGQMSRTHSLPGVAVIDATTRKPIASASFDFDDSAKEYFEPHGMGMSADGRWIYLPTGTSPGFADPGKGRLLVIDALTLKLNKVIAAPTAPHHAKTFTNAAGKDLVLAYAFGESGYWVFDPADDNRVIGGIRNNDLLGRGYLGFVDPTGRYLFTTVAPPAGVENQGVIGVVDTTTWEVVTRIGVHDPRPIWVSFTADSRTAYVSGAHESRVVRIDKSNPNPSAWKVTGQSRAGLEGPYGILLNWEEDQIWTVGKGEGSHNLGIAVGLVEPALMTNAESIARPRGVYHTACLRADHATLFPNPDVSHMWLSCNSSFDVVVFDMDARKVVDRIPMPHGGSTHSGSFVRYTVDGKGVVKGEVLSDQNGLRGSALKAKRGMSAAVAPVTANEPARLARAFDAKRVATGEEIFERTAGGTGCAACHGHFAMGDLGDAPNLRGSDEARIRGGLQAVRQMERLRDQLSADDIAALAEYLRYLGSLVPAKFTRTRGGDFNVKEIRFPTNVDAQFIVENHDRRPCTFNAGIEGFETVKLGRAEYVGFRWTTPKAPATFEAGCQELPDTKLMIVVEAPAR